METRSGTIISVDSTVREDMRSFLLKASNCKDVPGTRFS